MKDAIKNFPKQFEFDPKIENESNLKRKDSFILAGMGGSHLAADVLRSLDPYVDLVIHRNYGLPKLKDKELRERLVIVSTYSGNTEEAISAFIEAQKKGLSLVAICKGGKLLELAKKHSVPYIQLPDTDIQPRSALGFSFLAILKMMGKEKELKDAQSIGVKLDALLYEKQGKELAKKLIDKVPIIYASFRNKSIAYNWKIKINETAKIPAFYNVFPELNHNEMTGFDVQDSTRKLSEPFHFIFLKDVKDDRKIQIRMEVLKSLYEKKGFSVEMVELDNSSMINRIFSSLLLADWTALYISKHYGTESEQVPMVEEFKKLIAKFGEN